MEEIRGTITPEQTIDGTLETLHAIEGRIDIAGINRGGAVDDVQINGTSIVVDKVANIPIATTQTLGVLKTSSTYGTYVNSSGFLQTQSASEVNINDRTNSYKPIVPNNFDYAVKAAMTDGKGAGWTEVEKANARARMGVNQAYLVEEFTLAEDADAIERSTEPDGTPYNFESLVVVIDCNNLTFNAFSMWLRLNHLKNGQWVYSGQGAMGTNNNKYGVFKWIKTINGFIDSGYDCSANNSATGTQALSVMAKVPSNIVRLNTIINDFRLYTTGSSVIPAGTKISIYGVRA